MVDATHEIRSSRPGGVLLSAVAAVSWSFLGMAGTAALGLHLLGADAAGELGPVTAAAVALAVGGKVVPAGDVEFFGLKGAEAEAAVDIAPLGVSLVGALLLGYVFLRSLRASGGVPSPAQLAARIGTVTVLFTALLGGLAWAGHSAVTLDGGSLGLDRARSGAQDELKERFGETVGDIGGGLLERAQSFADAKASVGFRVEAAPTLAAGALWALAVLLIALAVSRSTPLPPGRFWDGAHRLLRPAASALVLMLLVAVLAGLAAAVYGALAGGQPPRVAGAALLGAPNGAWLAVPLGLLVSWRGAVSGELKQVLPDPVDELLGGGGEKVLTMPGLAALDQRVWLLTVAGVLMLLAAGVLTGARTPLRGACAARFAVRCSVWLGLVTAVALPLLVGLTGMSANAGLSVLGVDAVNAGVELYGNTAEAMGLGLLWGAGAGLVGGLLACATGMAGRRASDLAAGRRDGPGRDRGSGGHRGGYGGAPGYPDIARQPGPYRPPPRPSPDQPNPYKQSAGPSAAPTVAGERVPGRFRPQPPPPGPRPQRGGGERRGRPE